MNTNDGQLAKFPPSSSYFGRRSSFQTNLLLKVDSEFQLPEEKLAEEWLSEEPIAIQGLKVLKDGNNSQLKARNIGEVKEKDLNQEREG